MEETLKVETDVLLIGSEKIEMDRDTIYEVRLTDGRTYSIVFDFYDHDTGPLFTVVIEIAHEFGRFTQTKSIYLTDIEEAIVKITKTDRKLKEINNEEHV